MKGIEFARKHFEEKTEEYFPSMDLTWEGGKYTDDRTQNTFMVFVLGFSEGIVAGTLGEWEHTAKLLEEATNTRQFLKAFRKRELEIRWEMLSEKEKKQLAMLNPATLDDTPSSPSEMH